MDVAIPLHSFLLFLPLAVTTSVIGYREELQHVDKVAEIFVSSKRASASSNQCARNRSYPPHMLRLRDLAQNWYFDDEAFVGYLNYLQDWQCPEDAKLVV